MVGARVAPRGRCTSTAMRTPSRMTIVALRRSEATRVDGAGSRSQWSSSSGRSIMSEASLYAMMRFAMSLITIESLVKNRQVHAADAPSIAEKWKEIIELKKQRNAFLPAHNYQVPE